MFKKYFLIVLTALAFCACFATSAAGASRSNEIPSSGDYYAVEMEISRNGLVIAQPRVVMETNKNVELTFDATPAGDGEAKLYLNMTPQVAGNAAEPVHLAMKLFDRFNGEWILRSETDVYTKLDTEDFLAVGTDGLKRVAPKFGIKFNVKRARDPRSSADH